MENLLPTIGNVTRIEYGGEPVVTTAQLAEFYETTAIRIQQNFNGNEDRFISGTMLISYRVGPMGSRIGQREYVTFEYL